VQSELTILCAENARLSSELDESIAYQAATSEVLKVISRSPSELQPILETIVNVANRLCEADGANIWRPGDGFLYPAASYGMPANFSEQLQRVRLKPDGKSIVARALLSRRTTYIPDIRLDPEYSDLDPRKFGGYRSHLAVPILREDTPVGVLAMGRLSPRPFTDKQIELVTTFADQAVIAMENARLFEAVQARTGELQQALEYQTAMSEVLNVMGRSPTNAGPVFQEIVKSAARLCGAVFSNVQLYDGEFLHVAATHNFAPEALEPFLRLYPRRPDRSHMAGRAVLTRATVHVPDPLEDREYAHDLIRIGKWRAVLAVPMLRDDRPVGAIVVSKVDTLPFSDRQIELLNTFADQAVIAIENVRLFEEAQARSRELTRSVSELRALSDVSRAVNSTLDLETVLNTIVARAVELSETDAGAIYVYSNRRQGFRLRATYGMADETIQAIHREAAHLAETAVGEAARTREPLQVPDLRDQPRSPVHEIIIEAGYRGLLIVPLLRPNRVVGALVVRRKQPGLFPDGTVRLLMTFAEQSVLAIQNARLFAEIEEKGRELAEVSRHKSQFLANMSHELRTPMNSVLGFTEMMADGLYGPLPERALKALARVQANGKHLLGLINDVLDLSKIESGQLLLALQDYSIVQVVNTVISGTESLARAKGLDLTAKVEENLPLGHADERRLTQVLLNLVGNAIKFTDCGSVEIVAGASNGLLSIAVQDTGPGIASDDQKRIFEEFQQVDSSSTREKGGSGLGLAISKRLVEMHGGTLTVDSVLGEGSTFRMVMPLRVKEQTEAA
jgi:signal transduction histidine kinase